ncbi:hypothetical protein [Pseudonocardia sp. ICBG601]
MTLVECEVCGDDICPGRVCPGCVREVGGVPRMALVAA